MLVDYGSDSDDGAQNTTQNTALKPVVAAPDVLLEVGSLLAFIAVHLTSTGPSNSSPISHSRFYGRSKDPV